MPAWKSRFLLAGRVCIYVRDEGYAGGREMAKATIATRYRGVGVPASPHLGARQARRIRRGLYEAQEIAGALHVAEADDVVLELGAGIGLVGAVVALNNGARRVLAFEANPHLIPAIEELYRVNGIGDRIAVRNAVPVSGAGAPARVPFHIRPNFRGSSLAEPEDGEFEAVDVPTADFEEVCREISATVLISDIEGGELDLLRGADLSRFRAVVIEFHPRVYGAEGMKECKFILRQAGFRPLSELSTRRVWTCLRAPRPRPTPWRRLWDYLRRLRG